MSRITYFEWFNSIDRRDTYQIHIRTALESDDLRALIEKALDPEPMTLAEIGRLRVAQAAAHHGYQRERVSQSDLFAATQALDRALDLWFEQHPEDDR